MNEVNDEYVHEGARVVFVNIEYNVGKYGDDGYFGKDAFEAVRRFQKDRGLLADGIVGRDTWRKLFG